MPVKALDVQKRAEKQYKISLNVYWEKWGYHTTRKCFQKLSNSIFKFLRILILKMKLLMCKKYKGNISTQLSDDSGFFGLFI